MNLCSDNHPEVCYEQKNCPACELAESIKTLEQEKKTLEDEKTTLEEKIEELTTENQEIRDLMDPVVAKKDW